MNDLEYLNQISASVNKPAKTGLLDKKMKIVLGVLGGVILLFIVLIVATAGSAPKSDEPTAASELIRLNIRAEELNKTVNTYNTHVRSSSLRSTGSQFSSILTEIATSSSVYLTQNLGVNPKSIAAPADDAAIITELNATLERARLNGLLDRQYAYEMYYQVRRLFNLEESVEKRTNDSIIRAFLDSSKKSLTLIEESFQNFSGAD